MSLVGVLPHRSLSMQSVSAGAEGLGKLSVSLFSTTGNMHISRTDVYSGWEVWGLLRMVWPPSDSPHQR